MSAAGRPPRVRVNAHDLSDGRGERPGFAEQPLRERLRLVGAVEGVALADLPHHRDERVVLEVLADAGQVDDRIDPDAAKGVGRADAGKQQQLR